MQDRVCEAGELRPTHKLLPPALAPFPSPLPCTQPPYPLKVAITYHCRKLLHLILKRPQCTQRLAALMLQLLFSFCHHVLQLRFSVCPLIFQCLLCLGWATQEKAWEELRGNRES